MRADAAVTEGSPFVHERLFRPCVSIEIMRDIAIVGSGIAGLVAAHGLRRAGQDVTIYSDRSAEQWLNESRPTDRGALRDGARLRARARPESLGRRRAAGRGGLPHLLPDAAQAAGH